MHIFWCQVRFAVFLKSSFTIEQATFWMESGCPESFSRTKRVSLCSPYTGCLKQLEFVSLWTIRAWVPQEGEDVSTVLNVSEAGLRRLLKGFLDCRISQHWDLLDPCCSGSRTSSLTFSQPVHWNKTDGFGETCRPLALPSHMASHCKRQPMNSLSGKWQEGTRLSVVIAAKVTGLIGVETKQCFPVCCFFFSPGPSLTATDLPLLELFCVFHFLPVQMQMNILQQG